MCVSELLTELQVYARRVGGRMAWPPTMSQVATPLGAIHRSGLASFLVCFKSTSEVPIGA